MQGKYVLIGCLTISMALNFNQTTFNRFIAFSFILSVVLFGIFYSCGEVIKQIKQGVKGKAIFFALCTVVLLGTALFFYVFITAGGIIQVVTPPHFRTNTITGSCDFGGFTSYGGSRDPWYYKRGCDVPEEKKLEILKKSEIFGRMNDSCISDCGYPLKPDCNSRAMYSEISCKDLF